MRNKPIDLLGYSYETEELVDPQEVFDEKGYHANLAAFTGNRVAAPLPSLDLTFVDSPLDKPVVRKDMKKRSDMLDNLENLGSDNFIILSKWC